MLEFVTVVLLVVAVLLFMIRFDHPPES